MVRGGQRVYSHDCVQKLTATEYDRALEVIMELFCQMQPPLSSTAEWSARAAAAGYTCGKIYSITGGHYRRGELGIRVETYISGISLPPSLPPSFPPSLSLVNVASSPGCKAK